MSVIQIAMIRKPRYKPENIQLSEYELGFIAGLIEADGCLSLTRQKCEAPVAKYWFKPVMMIANSSLPLIEWVKNHLGGFIYTQKNYTKSHHIRRRKPLYQFFASSNVLRGLLPKIKLIRKERQRLLLIEALSILEECQKQIARWHPQKYQEHQKRLDEIAQEIRNLNKNL